MKKFATLAPPAMLAVAALSFLAVTTPWLCAWLVLLLVLLVAWYVSWRISHDPFAPLFPVMAYLFLGLGVRGLALEEGWLPNRYDVPLGNQWLVASIFLMGVFAILSCIFGYNGRTGSRIGQRWGATSWVTEKYPSGAVVVFAVLSMLIGVASLVLLRHRFAGVATFGHTPAAVASQTSEGGLFAIDMLAYFPMAGALLTWRRKGIGLIGRVALVANLAIVVAWFLLAGRKSLLFELIFGLVIVSHYLHRRFRGRALVVLLVPTLVLVSVAFYFKAYGFKAQSIEEQYSQQPTWEAVVDPLLDRSYQFDAATMIVDKTRSINDLRLGSTLEELLWFYIPRQWWPDKPVSFSYSFAPEFFPGASLTASYAPSMMGELYLDFGFIGITFGFYLFGIILRACYEAFASRQSRLAAVAYTIVLFRLTNMVEGPISTHLEFLLAEILPLVVFVMIGRTMASVRPYGSYGEPATEGIPPGPRQSRQGAREPVAR